MGLLKCVSAKIIFSNHVFRASCLKKPLERIIIRNGSSFPENTGGSSGQVPEFDHSIYVCGKSYYNLLSGKKLFEYHNRSVATKINFFPQFIEQELGLDPSLGTISLSTISAGWGHTLLCWKGKDSNSNEQWVLYSLGVNGSQQLGHHDTSHLVAAGKVSLRFPDNVQKDHLDVKRYSSIKLSCGREHTLVALHDLQEESWLVFAFGNNGLGQLGGKPSSAHYFVHSSKTLLPLQPGSSLVQIEAGMDHSLLLFDTGDLLATGWNSDGQLGLGDHSNRSSFQSIETLKDKHIIKIASLVDHTLALSSDGRVYAWGNSEYCQCIPDSIEEWVPTPRCIWKHQERIVDIVAGGAYSLLLSETGKIHILGYGAFRGHPPDIATSKKMEELKTDILFQKLFSGGDFCVALSRDGKYYAWGHGGEGQLGNGSTENAYEPQEIRLRDNKRIDSIYPGFNHLLLVSKE